jgi:hypothetical protein
VTSGEVLADEAEILSRVVGEVWEVEHLVDREPPVALALGQDEVLVEGRPRGGEVVLPRAVVVGAVAQRHDARGRL